MDPQLKERLTKISEQIDVLVHVEELYLNLEASKRSLHAELYLKAEGKTSAEREARAYANPEWKTFVQGLVAAESSFNREKRRLELLTKAYDAAHLTYKIENSAIKRGVE